MPPPAPAPRRVSPLHRSAFCPVYCFHQVVTRYLAVDQHGAAHRGSRRGVAAAHVGRQRHPTPARSNNAAATKKRGQPRHNGSVHVHKQTSKNRKRFAQKGMATQRGAAHHAQRLVHTHPAVCATGSHAKQWRAWQERHDKKGSQMEGQRKRKERMPSASSADSATQALRAERVHFAPPALSAVAAGGQL